MSTFDVIVIGAGPAGEVCAGRLADNGLEVALVEEHLVGGECSFYGCMPSKALLRPAQVLAEARRVPGAREAVGELDVAVTLARRDEVIHDLDDSGQVPWVQDKGIELVRAHGRLTGERQVTAGDRVLEARRAVILAPGTGALLPPVDGLREAEPWTNREVTTAHEIPGRLLVLGGGPIGCEMGQAYATLGSQVTLVEAAERLLPREEPFASEHVAAGLRDAGVTLHLDARAAKVVRNGDGSVTMTLEDGSEITADELLCAIGRQPRTEDVGLDALGLEAGEDVAVDERLRVPGHPWLHVVGDANGRALLTQAGKYQARVACDVILGGEQTLNPLTDGPRSPRIVFTEPQVAAVGHTEATAAEAGVAVRIVETQTEGNAGGSFIGKGTDGTCRLVIDAQRDVIIGATFTGIEVAEWIHAATIAIVGEVPIAALYHAPPCFPTRSEAWLYLVEKALG